MLIPFATDREIERTPYVTIGIIAVNVLVFVLSLGPVDPLDLALVPSELDPLKCITHMFAHGDILHIAGNMLFLWVFGVHAELAMGTGRYLLLYFSAGIGAAFLHVAVSFASGALAVDIPMLGASGAVMGVVALFALRYRRVKVRFVFWYMLVRAGIFEMSALSAAIMYLVLDLLAGVFTLSLPGGGTAHWAHIGGFIVGGAYAFGGGAFQEGVSEEKREEVIGFFRAGAPKTAISLANKYLAKNPDDAEVHLLVADAQEALGADQRVVWHRSKALEALARDGQTDLAAETFEKVRAKRNLAQYDPALLYSMAQALDHSGRFASAVATYREILQHHATSRVAPCAALAAGLTAKGHIGDMDLARQYFDYTVKRWPDSPEAGTARRERPQPG